MIRAEEETRPFLGEEEYHTPPHGRVSVSNTLKVSLRPPSLTFPFYLTLTLLLYLAFLFHLYGIKEECRILQSRINHDTLLHLHMT